VATGGADAAFDLRLQALSIAEEIASPDPLWAADHAIAESLAECDRRRLAIFFAKRSIAAIESMRDNLAADRDRLERGFLSDKLIVYRHLADWLLADDRAPEAIEVLRLLKREEMYDFGQRAADSAAEASPRRVPYSAVEDRYARRLDRLQKNTAGAADGADASSEIRRLLRLRDTNKISADEARRLDALLSSARQREEVRVADYRRFIVDEREVVASRTPVRPAEPRADRREVRAAALASDEADAYYFMANEHLNLLFVSRAGLERRVVDVDASRLGRGVGDLLADLSSRESSGDPSRPDRAELYEWLGAPLDRIARSRGIVRINLWLDGVLRYVPFAALWDGQHYLVERYEFAYLFAGADEGAAVARRAPRRSLVAFGVTRPVGGLPALPGVGDELCGIVDGPVSGLAADDAACSRDGIGTGTLKGVGFANEYFTEARLRSMLDPAVDATRPRGSVLHMGTHFALRPGNMQRSWLMLGDGARLSLAGLRELDFDGVGLVTLSACETAMAGAVGDDGREIEGLPSIVHRRGAKAVVASLWRVDDRSTGALMRAFYASLERDDARVPDALRRAQLAMLGSSETARRSPYYWAAFVPSAAAR